MSKTNEERLAILETKIEAVEMTMETVDEKLDQLIANMNNNKGFWGGVIFIISAVGGIVQYFVINLFKGNGGN